MSDFHPLTITSKKPLTPNSVALTFDVPSTLKDTFSYTAGQYITLKQDINGEEVRRAYSLSSAPSSGEMTIGVKKVVNGTFSVYANDVLNVNDTIEVMPPEGRFVYESNGSAQNIMTFAAGSGITPIMAIAKTVLESHPENTFVLVYGNQTKAETMYLESLEALQAEYGERLTIQYVFSRANEEGALFGRIESSTVNLMLKNKFKGTSFEAFYLCGPEGMINLVTESLTNAGISKDHIHFELFTSSEAKPLDAQKIEGGTRIEILLDDETHVVEIEKKEIVLDALLKNDVDAPYSCQGGVCSSCIARVKEGKAEMVKNQILTDGEIEEGFILTCQAHALTDKLVIDFDDV
ncbi:MAG: ferredoxin--NADP reductase [Bacteroidota bacterium]